MVENNPKKKIELKFGDEFVYVSPTDVKYIIDIAHLLIIAKDYDTVENFLNVVLNAKPNDHAILFTLGYLYEVKGEYEKAYDSYYKSHVLFPTEDSKKKLEYIEEMIKK